MPPSSAPLLHKLRHPAAAAAAAARRAAAGHPSPEMLIGQRGDFVSDFIECTKKLLYYLIRSCPPNGCCSCRTAVLASAATHQGASPLHGGTIGPAGVAATVLQQGWHARRRRAKSKVAAGAPTRAKRGVGAIMARRTCHLRGCPTIACAQHHAWYHIAVLEDSGG